MKPSQLNGNGFPPFDCGFCNEDTPCVCREFVAQQAQAHAAERMVDFKQSNIHNTSNANTILNITNPVLLELPIMPPRTSILENLPAYQPPVPLRRKPTPTPVNSIFAVAPAPVQQPTPANCSGDPSNCMACADDAFGKAFCSAIEESVAAQAPCADCPCSQDVKTSTGCGNPSDCHCHPPTPLAPTPEPSVPETMPTNDAWRQIKSHPNVSFADLSLLADVVARRSKCTGPRVVISPAPGSITPERTASPSLMSTQPSEHDPVLLTDPHAHYREKERSRSSGPSSTPRLIPQEVLMRCARQRVREVPTDAVRAALRLLDAKFA